MSRNFTMDDVTVLHEDNSVLVVVKPQNIPSQADKSGDLDLLTLLKSYIKEKYNKPGNVYLGLVHRLDRPTGGVMVFAKNSKSAERLSKQIVEGEMTKQYLTTVVGCPKEKKRNTCKLSQKECSHQQRVCCYIRRPRRQASGTFLHGFGNKRRCFAVQSAVRHRAQSSDTCADVGNRMPRVRRRSLRRRLTCQRLQSCALGVQVGIQPSRFR